MFEQKIPVHKVALNFKCYNEVADFFLSKRLRTYT